MHCLPRDIVLQAHWVSKKVARVLSAVACHGSLVCGVGKKSKSHNTPHCPRLALVSWLSCSLAVEHTTRGDNNKTTLLLLLLLLLLLVGRP